MGYRNRLEAGATIISNSFIDRFLAGASGEYVKVYLYILRHEGENITVEAVADALNHTEADVRRALAYWERAGVLEAAPGDGQEVQAETAAAGGQEPLSGPCDLSRLERDEAFEQLLYIAQRYLNKTFTSADCDILGNLYGNLGMSAEVLEYLMEYSAQNHHQNLRYVEKLALDWHQKGIRTVDEAKEYVRKRTVYFVLKTMGISGRNPIDAETEYIDKWFRTYGFTREIVAEACRRTVLKTGKPSFPYADKILADWKKNGVKEYRDIEALDRNHEERENEKAEEKEKRRTGRPRNRFHNLEEHGYDYDQMVWEMIRSGDTSPEKGGTDGTQ